ncbi:hypothetical protein B0J17DRAFT_459828, partial [Rhizoctonia solani]
LRFRSRCACAARVRRPDPRAPGKCHREADHRLCCPGRHHGRYRRIFRHCNLSRCTHLCCRRRQGKDRICVRHNHRQHCRQGRIQHLDLGKSGASLVGVGLRINKKNNVIVRNLKISKVLASAGDALGIQEASKVWVTTLTCRRTATTIRTSTMVCWM